MEKTCYIFDIDGTLADITHRLHHVKTKPKNWKAFEAGIPNDVPIRAVRNINMVLSEYFYVVLSTGRIETSRAETEAWLDKNIVHFDAMYMRPKNDFREDTIIKKENLDRMISEGYKPIGVFEDRPRLLRMYRENGIPTFDVGNGEEF